MAKHLLGFGGYMPLSCSCTRINQVQAPDSGGSLRGGGAGEITEKLIEVERLLANKKPWPAFLHGGLVTDCPDDVQEALSWMASGAVGLLNLASIGPLTPVCQAFKGLIEAAEGAAEADEKLRGLITWCVFLTEVLLQHGKEVDALAPVMTPLGAFVDTANELAMRARTLTGRRKWTAICCYWRDGNESQDFDAKLRRIWGDIQGLTTIAIHADLRRILPPQTGEMAKVPDRAVELPPAYVERTRLTNAVVQDLVATGSATDKAHVLRGIPGGGKTIAASAVVRDENVRRSFKDGIFWVQVGQVGTGHSLALLRGLAEDLSHAPSNRPHVVPHEFRDLKHVIGHLAGIRQQGNLRCLIVLDDVWDPQIAPLFLRTGFHCLVTTRDLAAVPLHLRGTCTAVDTLTEVEALKLLKEASGAASSIPREEGLKVARDCGFLPLAISIVGAMSSARSNPHSPETWTGVHAQLVEEPTLVQDHVTGALAASFGELGENAKTRFRKLGVLARGVRVPIDMVAHLWELDQGDTSIFVSDLVGKSFVKVVEHKYFLHDLVLDFAKDELRKLGGKEQLVTSRQAQYLGTMSVLEVYAKAGEVLRGFYALMALWQSVEDLSDDKQLEVRTYSANLQALEGKGPTEDLAFSNWAVGRLFEIQGKHEEAEPLFKRSLTANEEMHGSDHPAVAVDLHNLASLLWRQGKHEEAERLYKESMAMMVDIYGPEDPAIATGLSNWAVLLLDQGKDEEAERLFKRSVSIEKVHPNHPAVAAGLHNWAGLLMKQSKYEEAESLYKRSLAILQEVHGPEHPEVATSLSNLAALLMEQGKHEEAEPLYKRALALTEKVYGPDHPEVATDLGNYADMLIDQGKHEEAESLYKRALAITEKVYGSDHPEVAKSLSSYADVLIEQGKHGEADGLYMRHLGMIERLHGSEQPEMATALNHWAGSLTKHGKYEEAEPVYKRALAVSEKVYGSDHPEVAKGLGSYADVLIEQGKYEEAVPLFKQSLSIKSEVYGPEHPEVASGVKSLAGLLMERGHHEEAEPLYSLSLGIDEKIHGPEHPEIATGLVNWARVMMEQGKYSEAERLYMRSLAIKEKVHGPEHPEVALDLSNRAGLLLLQNKYEEAEAVYRRLLSIEEKVHGPEHPEVAKCLNNWVGVLMKQGKYKEAEPLYNRFVSIKAKVCGAEHQEVATGLYNLAGLFMKQLEYSEAIPLLERALSIRKKLGDSHPDTVDTQDRLDLALEQVVLTR